MSQKKRDPVIQKQMGQIADLLTAGFDQGKPMIVIVVGDDTLQTAMVNRMGPQLEIMKRLRDERDALLKEAGALVEQDFGRQCWTMKCENAAVRLRKLVTKMREDYDE